MYTIKTNSPHPVTHVVFSPGGATIAVAQPHTGVTLLDRTTGQETGKLALPRVSRYSGVAFCDGGRRLALGTPKGVYIFETATGTIVGHEPHGWILDATLTECGGELLAAGPRGVRWVEFTPIPNYRYLVSRGWPRPPEHRALVVALSPCGRWGFGLRQIRPVLLDLASGRAAGVVDHTCCERDQFQAHVAFSPDGERFTVCDGTDVCVFDTAEADPDAGAEPEEHPSLLQRVGGTAIAPKPAVVLPAIFRLGRPEGVKPSDRWQPPVALTPGGRGLLVRRPRNRIQLWDVATGCLAAEWSWRLEWVTCLAVAPDGLTAAAGARHGRVVLWDLE